MEPNQQEALALLERMERGEKLEDLANATPPTPPAEPPAAATPPPVTPPEPVAPAAAPATPPVAVTPEPPKPQETAEEKLRRLEAEHEELKKRFGGLRATRDERADKLQKEIDDLKAKDAERERQRKLDELNKSKPEGFDDFAPILEHANKVAQVVAPPPSAPPEPQAPAAPPPIDWFNTVADAVPEFVGMSEDKEFVSYLADHLAKTGTIDKWKFNPAWAAANVRQFHAEFRNAKDAAAKQQRQQQTHLSGTEIPNGTPGPRPVTTGKQITAQELTNLMLESPKFVGKSWAEVVRLVQSEGYTVYG
jgi:hypothetical protein